MTVARIPMEVRFWRHVSPEPTSGCWLWTSAVDSNGYGKVWMGPEHGCKCRRASRLSWEIHYGPIPPGMLVCHRCDTPPCVNPEHLFLGTCADNLRDAARKGRMSPQAHPERYRGKGKPKPSLRKPARPCVNCGRVFKPLRRGECNVCSNYRVRTGKTRPLTRPTDSTCVECGGVAAVGTRTKGRCHKCNERERRRRLHKAKRALPRGRT